MAILNKCELHFIRLDPKRPSKLMDPKNPTWEVQLRTTDPAQKDEWKEKHLQPKLMVYKEGHEKEGQPMLSDDGKTQWRVNLKKKSVKENGDAATPPEVVDGTGKPVDPNTVGNGSVANVRVFQYDYKSKKDNSTKYSSVLMAVQLTKHKVYVPRPREEFGTTETEVVAPEMRDEEDDASSSEPASNTPNPPSTVPADERY